MSVHFNAEILEAATVMGLISSPSIPAPLLARTVYRPWVDGLCETDNENEKTIFTACQVCFFCAGRVK